MSKLGKYFRKKRHRDYLEKSVIEMRSKICKQACLTGEVDMLTRHLLIKFNNRLRKWDEKNKENYRPLFIIPHSPYTYIQLI